MILPLLLSVAAKPSTPRALWVWEGSRTMLTDSVSRDRFFAFVEAPRGDKGKAIRTVFFGGATKEDLIDPERVSGARRFVAEAHRRGVHVEYLVGNAQWAEPSGRPEALTNLSAVLAYNRAAKPKERFDGFQYDVEPYLLKSWPAPSTVASFLGLFDRANATIRASGTKLVLGAAIPRWFDSAELKGLHKAVIDRTDYVAIMDYVDGAKAFVDDGRAEVDYATAKGKTAWLGAETQSLADEPRATFFAVGERNMEESFAAAVGEYGKRKGFGGVAIHYYDSYLTLRP